MTDHRTARALRLEQLQQSILAMLADSPRPLSTAELESAHGQFLTGRIYTVLRSLQDARRVVRQDCLRVSAGRTVFWWLPGRPPGTCAIEHCDQAGTGFVPPRFEVKDSYITDQVAGLRRLLWREVVELPGTGGWVCSNSQHRRQLIDLSRTAHRPGNGQQGQGEN